MVADRSTAELERFLAQRADHLLRTAVLLTGGREAGEDLLQTAVERLLRRWRRFDGEPEGYLRRTLCNLAIDGHRRAGRWRQKERLLRTAQPGCTSVGSARLRAYARSAATEPRRTCRSAGAGVSRPLAVPVGAPRHRFAC
jgi:DNA-directed RNA polymerase specialized sigma24 family protein